MIFNNLVNRFYTHTHLITHFRLINMNDYLRKKLEYLKLTVNKFIHK